MANDVDEIDELVRRIKAEAMSNPLPCEYNLSNFCLQKAVQDTSEPY